MATTALEGIRSFARRDQLLKIQSDVQKRWEDGEVFKAEAGSEPPAEAEKYFGNFPYPYMNGSLHLGHAFSLSKLEFASAYYRLRGRNVLFPFAFHCTGMPIKACADKLDHEIKQFGNPPVFPIDNDDDVEDEHQLSSQQQRNGGAGETLPGQYKSKRSKASAKKGAAKYQWQIMQSLGLKDSEIAQFRDPYHWLTHFPPLAKEDLKMFGAGVDWRRSFITTDMNPFYDSFVRWQMRTLKDMGKIVKDMRYTIYSPLDGQPCADHDRASGEGVQPQEYTLIKMEVIPPFTEKLKILEGRRVFLAAATLRPETMYGQTNAWVLPDGKYGAFEINDTDVFVVTERAALNLAYQHMSKVPEKPTCLVELTGRDLIGLPLRSPLTANDVVYALPMLTILTDKGTGIVTSVPSDSPDDYMALLDLKLKAALRAKFGVKDEWVLPFEIISIINIPEFGDKSAEKVCIDLKIKSQNDKDKLAEAKRLTYLKGFTDGTMLVGEFKGSKVQEAKPQIRKKLLESEEAVMYSEPEKKVISRSGDECVVALTDQWYILYGEPGWRTKAEECLAKMELYSDEARHGFENTLSWLNQWACSRSFGLGTRIPWDEQFLVESLSDSTLYMAYYTVSHLLQNGDMYGKTDSVIKAEQMTDEVWDYIFREGPFPQSEIPSDLLKCMKKEFEYWYPFDLRVSANAAILRLTKEITWMEEILAAEASLRQGPPSTFADRVFNNEINIAIKLTENNYSAMMFREALKTGFYDLQAARDEYRLSCGLGGMNRDLLWRFMDIQTRLITPLCPHYAEHVWKEVLKKDGFAVRSGWPTAESPDLTLQRANKYLQDTIVSMRKLLQKQMSAPKKAKKGTTNSAKESEELKPSVGLLYVAEEYKDWKATCLGILQDKYDRNSRSFAPDQEILAALKKSPIGNRSDFKQVLKQCMPFLKFKKDETLAVGPQALDAKLPFGEIQVLLENVDLIKRQIGLEELEVLSAADENAKLRAGPHVSVLNQTPPSPGNPISIFMTASDFQQSSANKIGTL
ncbi:hypothetical protein SUGI_0265820 [Cryptomeria japonica]|nr:hypothetical protein SUGI_0265820 [Cryptomeria japonica]